MAQTKIRQDQFNTPVLVSNGGTGQTTNDGALNTLLPDQTGNIGKFLTTDGSNTSWGSAGAGSVTSLSVSSLNGFAGSVSNPTTTPDITLSTTITGLLKGDGTSLLAASSSDITSTLGYTPVNIAGDTMAGYLILNADPATGLGAATKQYVDNVANGMNVHLACVAGTTADLAADYDNGFSGVGATLTANPSVVLPLIDTVALSPTQRVLVKNQADPTQNGIYTVTQTTAPWILTRATDFDNSPPGEITAGDSTFIQEGSQATTQWVQVTSGTITVGSSNIVFTQFGGPGTYSAGLGIDIAGTVISLATSNVSSLYNLATNGLVARTASNTVTARTITAGTAISVTDGDGISGNPTINNTGVTSVAGTTDQIAVSGSTGAVTFSLPSSVTIGGTMTAGTFSGSGSSLTSIPNGALTNSSVTIGSTSISLGATSTTLAGLTSVAATTFTGALSGNATTASSAATLTTPRNINGVSFNGSADITVTAAAGTLTGSTLAAGVTASSLTSVGTLGSLSVSGSLSASSGSFTGNVTGGTSVTAGSGAVGKLNLNQGGASNTGYVEFNAANGNRQGYIGFSSTTGAGDTGTIPYIAGQHQFTGAVNLNGTTSPLLANGSDGTSGQVLTSAGAGATPTWTTPAGSSFKGALVGRTTNITITGSSETAIPFTTETYDTDGFHDNVTNNTRLTIPSGVNYVVLTAGIAYTDAGGSTYQIQIKKNGTTTNSGLGRVVVPGDGSVTLMYNLSSAPVSVTAGDYFEVTFFHPTTNIDVQSTSWFGIQVVG